jgi:hypothetical protein
MATYLVRVGDSPASIAARLAGCPKCAGDLVAANPHKKRVRYPNGFVTFESLAAGERLNVPGKWTSGELDRLPPSYFAGLPTADGQLGALPTIAHCHGFTGTLVIDQSLASDPTAQTVSKALGAGGFTNYFQSPPDQNGNIAIGGVWEAGPPLDTSQAFDDGQGSRVHFLSAQDSGVAQGQKSGPCVSLSKNLQIIQPQKGIQPPKKSYAQPQGHVPNQGLKNPSGCPANYARDTVTNQCTPVCPDGSASVNGQCAAAGLSTGAKWAIGLTAAALAIGGVVYVNR